MNETEYATYRRRVDETLALVQKWLELDPVRMQSAEYELRVRRSLFLGSDPDNRDAVTRHVQTSVRSVAEASRALGFSDLLQAHLSTVGRNLAVRVLGQLTDEVEAAIQATERGRAKGWFGTAQDTPVLALDGPEGMAAEEAFRSITDRDRPTMEALFAIVREEIQRIPGNPQLAERGDRTIEAVVLQSYDTTVERVLGHTEQFFAAHQALTHYIEIKEFDFTSVGRAQFDALTNTLRQASLTLRDDWGLGAVKDTLDQTTLALSQDIDHIRALAKLPVANLADEALGINRIRQTLARSSRPSGWTVDDLQLLAERLGGPLGATENIARSEPGELTQSFAYLLLAYRHRTASEPDQFVDNSEYLLHWEAALRSYDAKAFDYWMTARDVDATASVLRDMDRDHGLHLEDEFNATAAASVVYRDSGEESWAFGRSTNNKRRWNATLNKEAKLLAHDIQDSKSADVPAVPAVGDPTVLSALNTRYADLVRGATKPRVEASQTTLIAPHVIASALDIDYSSTLDDLESEQEKLTTHLLGPSPTDPIAVSRYVDQAVEATLAACREIGIENFDAAPLEQLGRQIALSVLGRLSSELQIADDATAPGAPLDELANSRRFRRWLQISDDPTLATQALGSLYGIDDWDKTDVLELFEQADREVARLRYGPIGSKIPGGDAGEHIWDGYLATKQDLQAATMGFFDTKAKIAANLEDLKTEPFSHSSEEFRDLTGALDAYRNKFEQIQGDDTVLVATNEDVEANLRNTVAALSRLADNLPIAALRADAVRSEAKAQMEGTYDSDTPATSGAFGGDRVAWMMRTRGSLNTDKLQTALTYERAIAGRSQTGPSTVNHTPEAQAAQMEARLRSASPQVADRWEATGNPLLVFESIRRLDERNGTDLHTEFAARWPYSTHANWDMVRDFDFLRKEVLEQQNLWRYPHDPFAETRIVVLPEDVDGYFFLSPSSPPPPPPMPYKPTNDKGWSTGMGLGL